MCSDSVIYDYLLNLLSYNYIPNLEIETLLANWLDSQDSIAWLKEDMQQLIDVARECGFSQLFEDVILYRGVALSHKETLSTDYSQLEAWSSREIVARRFARSVMGVGMDEGKGFIFVTQAQEAFALTKLIGLVGNFTSHSNLLYCMQVYDVTNGEAEYLHEFDINNCVVQQYEIINGDLIPSS